MLRYDGQIKPRSVALYDITHQARKRSGSILTTTESARGQNRRQLLDTFGKGLVKIILLL